MAGAAKLTIVRRTCCPIDHLVLDLTQAECGARQWALRVEAGPVIASGFLSEDGLNAGTLRNAADTVAAFVRDCEDAR